jgi:hypothetical protein
VIVSGEDRGSGPIVWREGKPTFAPCAIQLPIADTMSILFRSSHVSYNVSLKHVQLFKKIRQGIQEDTSAADEVRPKPHVMLAKRLRPQPQNAIANRWRRGTPERHFSYTRQKPQLHKVRGVIGCSLQKWPLAGLRDGVRLLSEMHPLRLRPPNEK